MNRLVKRDRLRLTAGVPMPTSPCRWHTTGARVKVDVARAQGSGLNRFR